VRYDAIIIGAGMSGLAAGIRLAWFGRRVAIVEKHYVWGGLNSFYGIGRHAFDVGLHALTNYVPAGTRGAPLTRVLKQLRLRHADLRLGEHGHSEILFPGVRLRFTNDPEVLADEVARAFPAEAGRFRRLVTEVRETAFGPQDEHFVSARAALGERLRDPLLVEMLLLPTCYYGSALEDDVEWDQFKVLFRSIFLEGLARPEGGVRRLLGLLVKRFKHLGGELRMRNGVRGIRTDAGAVRGLVLEDGTELETDLVLSSAGRVETMRLCGEDVRRAELRPGDEGRVSFLESISVTDARPVELGHAAATCFFSTRERFDYRRPDDLVDLTSGLVSSPNNFHADEPLPEGVLRLTVLANGARWPVLPKEEYVREKERLADAAVGAFAAFAARERFPGGERRDWRPATTFRDVFTPRTIEHFTGHRAGSVYGSPRKSKDGTTGVGGLVLCGTDQGYLGIVGALHSGVLMANRHALVPAQELP
jgi:phytoene dehydrogenase-like protein